MLKGFVDWLRGRHRHSRQSPANDNEHRSFEQLNRAAPLRQDNIDPADAKEDAARTTYLCREAILGLDQRIAGYQFMLHEGTRNRIRNRSRRVHHLYAEVLVRTLHSLDVARLLGHRFAFIEVPDSFLDHPSLDSLPAPSVVVMPMPHRDNDAPANEHLRQAAIRLRKRGFRLALPDPLVISEYTSLLDQADLVVLRAPTMDAQRGIRLSRQLQQSAPQAKLLVRELPTLEEFQFACKMGASLFQGPFITSREEWSAGELNPNMARLAAIIARLRNDGDTREISELLKQDGALAIRLLRYINSAAYRREQSITSIEHALTLLGRDRLYRWLVLLAFTSEHGGGRSASAMETALIRGRLMELLALERNPQEAQTYFLAGLLSLADVIMQAPLEKVLAPFDLSTEVTAALLKGEGPLAPVLELAIACEQDERKEGSPDEDENELAKTAERCGISPEQATNAHLQALVWALEIER